MLAALRGGKAANDAGSTTVGQCPGDPTVKRIMKRTAKPSATPAARYRVALHGFSEFERNALAFCLKHAAQREPAYVQVERLADSDFIVADASHEVLATSATRGPRMRDTLFVGAHAPPGARSHVERPIDPENILRALDDMANTRDAPPGPKLKRERPDIVLPMPASDSDFPTLSELDIVETTPAAFHHESTAVRFTDIDAVAERAGQPTPVDPSDLPPPLPAAPLAPPPEPAYSSPASGTSVAPGKRAGSAGLTEEERHTAKAAARRKSRAARLTQARRAGTQLEDVLLLDATTEPVALDFLLEAFGFRVLRVRNIAAAMGAIASTPLAAAFVDIDVEDEDGIDGMTLCQMIKQRVLEVAGEVPPVILMSRRKVAAERVQAKLAGCEAFLTQPITAWRCGTRARNLRCRAAGRCAPRRAALTGHDPSAPRRRIATPLSLSGQSRMKRSC